MPLLICALLFAALLRLIWIESVALRLD